MAAMSGVAGAKGRVARPESHAPARPLCGRTRPLRQRLLHGHRGGALGGGPEGEGSRVGALHRV